MIGISLQGLRINPLVARALINIVVTNPNLGRKSAELGLNRQKEVREWLALEEPKPDLLIVENLVLRPCNEAFIIQDRVTDEPIGVVDVCTQQIDFYCRYMLEEEALKGILLFLTNCVFPEGSFFPVATNVGGKMASDRRAWFLPVDAGGRGWSPEEKDVRYLWVQCAPWSFTPGPF